jgi:uncharacterized protein
MRQLPGRNFIGAQLASQFNRQARERPLLVNSPAKNRDSEHGLQFAATASNRSVSVPKLGCRGIPARFPVRRRHLSSCRSDRPIRIKAGARQGSGLTVAPILTVASALPIRQDKPHFNRTPETDFRRMDTLFPILGILLIVASLAQIGLWSGRMLRAGRHERARFHKEMRLLQARIDEVSARRQARVIETQKESEPAGPVVPQSDAPPARVISPVDESCTGTWTEFRKFRVSKIQKESENTTSIYLQPVVPFPLPAFQPGQYLTIRVQIPGSPIPVTRCYTLSDAPGKPGYRISVKKKNPDPSGRTHGLASHFINEKMTEGSTIDVRPPSGSFCLTAGETPLVLLAAGIGITPMMSMLNHVAASASSRQILLVYGVRNGKELVFANELSQLQQTRSNIHVIRCFSQPLATDKPNADYQVHGRISVSLLQRVLPAPDFDFLMCGPSLFMETLYRDLRKWGVPDSRIHFESFGPASPRRDGSGASVATAARAGGNATVQLNRSGKQLAWASSSMTLLELLEMSGVATESGCRSGNCGTCACRITEGVVRYDSPPEACPPGHVLPCVALPDGPIGIEL